MLHFDTYFKTYLSCRNDLTLLDNLEDGSPLPKHAILQILRVTQIILENCANKSSFDGLEVSWSIVYYLCLVSIDIFFLIPSPVCFSQVFFFFYIYFKLLFLIFYLYLFLFSISSFYLHRQILRFLLLHWKLFLRL